MAAAPGYPEGQRTGLHDWAMGRGRQAPEEAPPSTGNQGEAKILLTCKALGANSSAAQPDYFWVQQPLPLLQDPCSVGVGKREKGPPLLVSPQSEPPPFSDFLLALHWG